MAAKKKATAKRKKAAKAAKTASKQGSQPTKRKQAAKGSKGGKKAAQPAPKKKAAKGGKRKAAKVPGRKASKRKAGARKPTKRKAGKAKGKPAAKKRKKAGTTKPVRRPTKRERELVAELERVQALADKLDEQRRSFESQLQHQLQQEWLRAQSIAAAQAEALERIERRTRELEAQQQRLDEQRAEIEERRKYPPPPPAPARPVLPPNVYQLGPTDPAGYDEGAGRVAARSMVTNRTTVHDPNRTNYADSFAEWFSNYSGHTPATSPDEIPIFRHGVMFSGGAEITRAKIEQQKENLPNELAALMPSDWSAHIVDEGWFLSVRINMGDYEAPTTMTEAADQMARSEPKLAAIRDLLWDYWDDIDWCVFADIDPDYLYE